MKPTFLGKVTGLVLEGERSGNRYEFEVASAPADCAFYVADTIEDVAEVEVHFDPKENWLRYVTWTQMPQPTDGTEAPYIKARRKCSIETVDLDWSGVRIKAEKSTISPTITVNGAALQGLHELDLFVSATGDSDGTLKIYPTKKAM